MFDTINVWVSVSTYILLPWLFLPTGNSFSNNGLGNIQWTSLISNLYTEFIIISREVSGFANGPPYDVGGNEWTICQLYDGLFWGVFFKWHLVCNFGTGKIIFHFLSKCFFCSEVLWSFVCNFSSIHFYSEIFFTAIFHRLSLDFFLSLQLAQCATLVSILHTVFIRPIPRLQNFTFSGKTSYRSVNRGSGHYGKNRPPSKHKKHRGSLCSVFCNQQDACLWIYLVT